MKHEWIRFGEDRKHPFQRLRRCKHCRAIQEWVDEQNWGRVVGYRWYPPAGRCRPLEWKQATHGRQETRCGTYWVERDTVGRWHAHYHDDQDGSLRYDGFPTRQEAKEYCEREIRTNPHHKQRRPAKGD